MPDILAKIPFLRLLLALLAGICVQYYYPVSYYSIVILVAGLILMLASYSIRTLRHYKWRWVFGAGLFLVLFGTGTITTAIQQKTASFDFSPEIKQYKGIVTGMPQLKEKSIACDVELSNGKKMICYFQKGVRSRKIQTGDEIIFDAKIDRFKHFPTTTNFDYPAYMYNKGVSGSVYLFSDDWEGTGKNQKSLQSVALGFRQRIIDFYGRLGLDDNSFSILSALTLGYKESLSEDVVQSFRNTGTAHILAVSGMHTGIIYGVLLGMFSLFFRNVRYNRIAQSCIIVCLWGYALITGFSPSVVRACFMLSLFCMGNILNRNGFTYNNIFIAAFIMLLYNPFWLFDVGFQLSFSAVIAIRFFIPYFEKIINPKNKLLKAAWGLSCLSFAAQMGTFPLCLYYFGTFPTYFFITNLLIIPLVSVIVYLALFLLAAGFISHIIPALTEYLYIIPVTALKFIVNLMVDILKFFENLPFSTIRDINLPLVTAVLLIISILFAGVFLKSKAVRALQFSLLFLFCSFLYLFIPPKNSLSVYQNRNGFLISWNERYEKYETDSIEDYQYIKLGNQNFLSISDDVWKNKKTRHPFPVDYLHIVKNDSISLYSLTERFSVKKVILDNSLSTINKKKLIKECENLGLPYYDVSEKGLFSINF